MLFKLSNLNSNLALTLGYLNPALNNSAPELLESVSNDNGDGIQAIGLDWQSHNFAHASRFFVHFLAIVA